MLECDLTKHTIVAGGRRAVPVVRVDGVGSQEVDDELVDRRQLLHEIPRILTAQQSFLDDRVELLVRLGPEHLEACATSWDVIARTHQLSLTPTPVVPPAGDPVGRHRYPEGMSPAEYLDFPIDPISADRLSAQGLRLGTVDTTDAAAFRVWLEAETRGFHGPLMNDRQVTEQTTGLTHRRSTGVWDDSIADAESPVATVSGWPMALTVPGERSIDTWGISAVTVAPTHRRRGIARAILESELRTASALGLPLAILTVSESTIYGRYGFAPAALTANFTIDTSRAAWAGPVPGGRVQFLSIQELAEQGPEIIERVRLATPGQVEFDGTLWTRLVGTTGDPEENRKLRCARYDDESGAAQGFVIYSVTETPNDYSRHTIDVKYLSSATDDAYAALWRFLLEQDLVTTITALLRPVDEPLQWMVTDFRAVSGITQDHLWVRVLDVPTALEARSYPVDATLVVSVTDPLGFAQGAFSIVVRDGEATVSSVDETTSDAATIALGVNELGALYLGTVSATTLERAGRLRSVTAGAAEIADSLFRSARAPWLSIWF